MTCYQFLLKSVLDVITGISVLVPLDQSAQALQIVQTASISPIPTDFTDAPLSPAFSQFNPTLGSLDSIGLSLTAGFSSDVFAENFGFNTSNYTATTNGTIDLDIAGLTNVLTANLSDAASGSIAPFSSTSFTLVDEQTVSTTLFGGGFIGTGLITGNLDSSFDFFFSGSFNLSLNNSTTAGGTVTLTYNYTSSVGTPEPSSLIGLGFLIGLGLKLRGKEKSI